MKEFVGIDISKDWLDIHCFKSKSAWRCRNTPEAHTELLLKLPKARLVVLEATGGYERPLVNALRKAKFPVYVANPRRIRDFARSTGLLAKTDKIDAQILALFASTFALNPQPEYESDILLLKELNALRQDIVQQITAHLNRKKQVSPESPVYFSLSNILTCLEAERNNVDNQIQQVINGNKTLKAKAKVLKQVKGVGPVLLATLLGDLPELGTLDRQKLSALVGVAPFNCDSGHYRGRRRIWGGRQQVRNILYMGANISRRYDPQMNQYFQQLIQQNKPFKVALVACMRKLLTQLNAKMRDHLSIPENA